MCIYTKETTHLNLTVKSPLQKIRERNLKTHKSLPKFLRPDSLLLQRETEQSRSLWSWYGRGVSRDAKEKS